MKTILPDIRNKNGIIKKLEENLDSFERVFLINDECIEQLDLMKFIVNYLSGKEHFGRILLMSSTDSEINNRNISIQKISKEDEQMIMALYRLYDFSDRFSVIDRNIHNGDLFNYVEKGVLTFDEAVEAMLGA